jgi:SAM-dependent methyltransferase
MTDGGQYTNQTQLQIVSDICSDWQHQEVLEIGCGTGRFTMALLQTEVMLTVADISSNMLQIVKQRVMETNKGHLIKGYTEASITGLPFPDDSFDAILSINVFNHLPNIEEALSQCARVLRPGGTLLFNYANLNSYYWPIAWKINRSNLAIDQNVFSIWRKPNEVRHAIEGSGFTSLGVIGHVHIPRSVEPLRLNWLLKRLDVRSRYGPLKRFAPIHFVHVKKYT